ncbi:MAG: hypothetical protein WD672_06870, partial [Woeseia sp.]
LRVRARGVADDARGSVVCSPENTRRISGRPEAEILEGFPLLHLDCYTDDGGAFGWPDWINRYGYRKTAPGRGIRYKKVLHALEAVYANAGLILGGLALVTPQLKDGRLSLPFPVEQGAWSGSAYRSSFRESSLRRNQIRQFRSWLLTAAGTTRKRLREFTGDAATAH